MYQHFGGTFYSYPHSSEDGYSKFLHFSETLILIHPATYYHIPEDCNI
jgi:hypothetical protein